MSKRFLETNLITQNKWFRKLKPKYKLFWVFLILSCDSVGVWEVDFELISFIIGNDYDEKETLEIFNDKILVFKNDKWWIKDFCDFQYGKLNEENINNKPHQSYINLLKKHSLWKEYTKTIHSFKEKEKDKEKDKEKGTKHKYGKYNHVLLTDIEKTKLETKFSYNLAMKKIKDLDEGIEMHGYKYQNHYLTILKWHEKDVKANPQKYPVKKKESKTPDHILKNNEKPSPEKAKEVRRMIKESLGDKQL